MATQIAWWVYHSFLAAASYSCRQAPERLLVARHCI